MAGRHHRHQMGCSLIIACFVDAEQPQVNRVLPSATLSLMSSKFDGVS
jgi:hypothetical protein